MCDALRGRKLSDHCGLDWVMTSLRDRARASCMKMPHCIDACVLHVCTHTTLRKVVQSILSLNVIVSHRVCSLQYRDRDGLPTLHLNRRIRPIDPRRTLSPILQHLWRKANPRETVGSFPTPEDFQPDSKLETMTTIAQSFANGHSLECCCLTMYLPMLETMQRMSEVCLRCC